LVHKADRSDTKVSRENSIKFVTPKWGELFDPTPRPQIILGGWNFAETRLPPRPVRKKILAPQPTEERNIGGQRKIFPSRPLKIPSMYSPKILPWLALHAPYIWPKFGKRSIGRFSARTKKNAGFRRHGSSSVRFH